MSLTEKILESCLRSTRSDGFDHSCLPNGVFDVPCIAGTCCTWRRARELGATSGGRLVNTDSSARRLGERPGSAHSTTEAGPCPWVLAALQSVAFCHLVRRETPPGVSSSPKWPVRTCT